MNSTADASAIERYERYLKADPQNVLLWISLGDLHHKAGHFKEAAGCYEKCLELEDKNTVARSRLANVMLSEQRFAEAETEFRRLIENAPDPALFHNLGLALYYQKRWREALGAFRQSRASGPPQARTQAYIVYCLHHLGETAQAMEASRLWLQEAPGAETEGYVAMLEMDNGDMRSAQLRAMEVLRLNPVNPDAGVVAGTWMIERQQIDQAIAYFSRVVSSEPDNPRGWQGLGLSYLYQQDFGGAIQALHKASSLMPDNATNLVILGWAELANKDAVKAEQSFRKAVGSDRNFGEAHGGLAAALVFQNKTELAREEIKTAMRLDPKGFGAVFANSILLQLQGKGQLGERMLAKLLEQTPGASDKPLIEHIRQFVRQRGAGKSAETQQNPGS